MPEYIIYQTIYCTLYARYSDTLIFFKTKKNNFKPLIVIQKISFGSKEGNEVADFFVFSQ